jgi:hypothetical protein
MAHLRQILVFVRQGNLARAVDFYVKGIGLKVQSVGENTAKLESGKPGSLPIVLKAVDGNEAALSSGYGPFLDFAVEDFDMVIPNLIQMGASLDGKIEYSHHGKIAAMRSPDGTMIGLFEKNEVVLVPEST